MSRTIRRHYRASGKVHDVDLVVQEGRIRARVDGEDHDLEARLLRRIEGGAEVSLVVDGVRRRAVVVRDRDAVHVACGGRTWRFDAVRPKAGGDGAAADAGDPFAASPMTGVVRKVLVASGDSVASGATLFVVEAMKMEFAVAAPRDVVVDQVRAAEGDRVDIQQVIVTFRAAAATTAASKEDA